MLLLFPPWEKYENQAQKECSKTGVILDESNNYEVVQYSFPPFSHMSQDIDWNTVRAFEMIDGIYASLYWYKDAWHLTSGYEPNEPQFKVQFKNEEILVSFSKFFWDIWNHHGYQMPKDTNVCYSFQVVSPRNRFVVKYEQDAIFLVAARDLKSCKELDLVLVAVEEHGWACPKTYPTLKSPLEIQQFLTNSNPFKIRGILALDQNFNRFEFSTKPFIGIQYATDFTTIGSLNWRGELDEKHAIDMIKFHEESVFEHYFPEKSEYMNAVKVKYDAMINLVENSWNKWKDLDAKDFGLEAKPQWFAFLLFKLKKNVVKSVKEYYALCDHKELTKSWNLMYPNL